MGKSQREAAFVLPVDAVVSRDAQSFSDFPGLYTPGEAVRIASLGFESIQEAKDRAKELGLPLESTTASFPDEEEEAEAVPAEPAEEAEG
jgi:hypothetical protein